MWLRNLTSLCGVLFLCTCIKAQTASINGIIVDASSGMHVENALVWIEGTSHNIITNDVGKFYLKDLPAGHHTIKVHSLGYEDLFTEIELRPDEELAIHLQLRQSQIELNAVEVSAEPELQAAIISRIDIQHRSHNTSQEILRMVPGLFIAQHAGGGKAEQIFLRGFDLDHGTDIAITTDGIPVNMVSHAHGQGYADLHNLIPETVDRVHFGKGPFHTHYGNLATAGYVGFQTRNRLEENTISFQAGQFNSYRGLALLKLLDKSDASRYSNAYVAGEYFMTDGYFDSPQNLRRKSLFGKFHTSVGLHNHLSCSISSFGSSWLASGQIPERAVLNNQIGFFGAIDDTEGGLTSRSNANIQLYTSLDENTWLKNQVYYSNYNFELYSNFTFFLHDAINGDQMKQKEKRNLFGYLGTYHRLDQIGSIHIDSEFGVQLRSDFSKNNELSHTAGKSITLERLSLGDIYETNFSTFFQETFRFSKLTVNTGLRYDHFVFSYVDKINRSDPNSTSSILSPKVNAYLQLNNSIQLAFNTGYGFHSNDTRVAVYSNGRETLPRAFGLDVGAIFAIRPGIIINATIWSLKLDQEFVYVGDEAIIEPSGKTRRMGIEVAGRWQMTDWLFSDIDLNYTSARKTEAIVDGNHIPLAPRFSSIGGMTVSKNLFKASLRYRLLGDRPANESNSLVARGYCLLDLLASYRIKKYEIGFGVDNLLNTRWKEAQFETESRLKNEKSPVSEIHFTPGTRTYIKAFMSCHF